MSQSTKITDITTPNLDQGQPSFRRNTSSVSFTLVDRKPEAPKKKGGFFSGILKAIGAFAPVGFLFGPPGWIAGAGAAGLGQLGAKMESNAQRQAVAPLPAQITYPGLSPASDQVLALVADARDNAFRSSIHGEMR